MTRVHGGLGLGLAIVRHLVELHGGSVRAESRGRGAGAAFAIRLPRRIPAIVPRDARKPVAEPSYSPREAPGVRLDHLRILLVDDDKESCDVLREALETRGAVVKATTSAAEAIDVLAAFNPDLVLTDLAMPGRDGFAVLQEVRDREGAFGRHVPVAAVTAHARAEDRERAIAAGFDRYLTKPVEPGVLASTVAALAIATNR
jgi:CheY-like chemotaxis protein